MEKKYFKYQHRIYIAKTTPNRPNHCVLWAIPADPHFNDQEYYFLGIVFRDGTIEEATDLQSGYKYDWCIKTGARRLFAMVIKDMTSKSPIERILDANRLHVYVSEMQDELKRYMSELGKKGQKTLHERFSKEEIKKIRSEAAIKGHERRKNRLSTPKGLQQNANEIKLTLSNQDISDRSSL